MFKVNDYASEDVSANEVKTKEAALEKLCKMEWKRNRQDTWDLARSNSRSTYVQERKKYNKYEDNEFEGTGVQNKKKLRKPWLSESSHTVPPGFSMSQVSAAPPQVKNAWAQKKKSALFQREDDIDEECQMLVLKKSLLVKRVEENLKRTRERYEMTDLDLPKSTEKKSAEDCQKEDGKEEVYIKPNSIGIQDNSPKADLQITDTDFKEETPTTNQVCRFIRPKARKNSRETSSLTEKKVVSPAVSKSTYSKQSIKGSSDKQNYFHPRRGQTSRPRTTLPYEMTDLDLPKSTEKKSAEDCQKEDGKEEVYIKPNPIGIQDNSPKADLQITDTDFKEETPTTNQVCRFIRPKARKNSRETSSLTEKKVVSPAVSKSTCSKQSIKGSSEITGNETDNDVFFELSRPQTRTKYSKPIVKGHEAVKSLSSHPNHSSNTPPLHRSSMKHTVLNSDDLSSSLNSSLTFGKTQGLYDKIQENNENKQSVGTQNCKNETLSYFTEVSNANAQIKFANPCEPSEIDLFLHKFISCEPPSDTNSSVQSSVSVVSAVEQSNWNPPDTNDKKCKPSETDIFVHKFIRCEPPPDTNSSVQSSVSVVSAVEQSNWNPSIPTPIPCAIPVYSQLGIPQYFLSNSNMIIHPYPGQTMSPTLLQHQLQQDYGHQMQMTSGYLPHMMGLNALQPQQSQLGAGVAESEDESKEQGNISISQMPISHQITQYQAQIETQNQLHMLQFQNHPQIVYVQNQAQAIPSVEHTTPKQEELQQQLHKQGGMPLYGGKTKEEIQKECLNAIQVCRRMMEKIQEQVAQDMAVAQSQPPFGIISQSPPMPLAINHQHTPQNLNGSMNVSPEMNVDAVENSSGSSLPWPW